MSDDARRIGTRRLYIETLRPEHAPALFAALSDPRVYAYIDERPPESPAALARRYEQLERGAPSGSGETWLNWAIRLRRRRECMGTLQATIYRDRTASIAYVISPRHWGSGYATEAVEWLVERLATAFRMVELRASVDVRNEASWRLLERLQFKRVEKRAAELHGEPTMDYRYRLIRPFGRAETDRLPQQGAAHNLDSTSAEHGS